MSTINSTFYNSNLCIYWLKYQTLKIIYEFNLVQTKSQFFGGFHSFMADL